MAEYSGLLPQRVAFIVCYLRNMVSRDPIAEFKRVSSEARQLRADAIRSRIIVSQTLCAIAKSEAHRTPVHARNILSKVRHSIDEIERHIAEPNHISPQSANELTVLLSALKARADSLSLSLSLSLNYFG